MKFFLDTANVEQISEAVSLGVVDGVTTNPSLIAKEGSSLSERISEIAQICSGPISAEVMASDHDGMIGEARELSKISPNVVVKIPLTEEGLKATYTLAGENIPVNVTLVFSLNQALLAARAGASYVSPFVGRVDDIGGNGIQVVEDIVSTFYIYNFTTEVIAASIRHPAHVTEAARSGCDIATIPYDVLAKMMKHPLTDAGIERFIKDWQESKSL